MSALSQFFGCGDTSSPVPSNFKMVEFLLLGGGGGGGYDTTIFDDPESYFRNGYGGGGGAGGMLEASNFAVKNGDTWSITIGAGGVGANYDLSRPVFSQHQISSDGEPSIVNGIEIGGGAAGGNALGANWPGGDSQNNYVFGGGASSGGGSGGGGAGGEWNVGAYGPFPSPRKLTTSSYNYSQTSGGYNLVSTVFGKTCVIKSFASPGVTFTSQDLISPAFNPNISFSGGGWGGGAGGNNFDITTYRTFGRPNNITGTNVNYCRGGGGGGHPWSGPSAVAVRGNRGDGGNAFAAPPTAPTAQRRTCEPGGNGAFAIRWPTEYPAASSVVGNDNNLPVDEVEGFYSYRWLGDGSITF